MSKGAGGRWLSVNPIWQKSARARLRPRHLVTWSVVTLTLTLFVSLMIYMNLTENDWASPEDAAKAVLPGIVVIQAVLLMVFGTGAVAAGVSQERDEGLLDYQRMTPMRPTAKILGYLFGLPVREYVLFAMTLPVVGLVVWKSGFSLLTLGHFYAVFFTSVLVYHMTGLVAGMVAPKPRLASMMSIGLVTILYFVLPNLSRLGITFFEFLTIRPTFFGLLQRELPEYMRARAEDSGIDSFRDVPVLAGLVHPTAYTILVQGFLIAVMFSMVHRKWRHHLAHPLSKLGALLTFAGVAFFLVGSVWAMVVQEEAYQRVFRPFEQGVASAARRPESLEILLVLVTVILGVAYLTLVSAVTASRHTTLEGWRRAAKLGRRGLGLNSDAASSFPVAALMLLLSLGAGGLLLAKVGQLGEYYTAGPSVGSLVVIVAGCAGVAAFIQGGREWMSLRAFGVGLFLLWMAPLFAMLIMYSAFREFVAGTYVGLPCPPVLLGYSIAQMLESTTPLDGVEGQFLPPELLGSAEAITRTGAAGYVVAGLIAQAGRQRARSRLRILGRASAPGGSPLDSPPLAAPAPGLDRAAERPEAGAGVV